MIKLLSSFICLLLLATGCEKATDTFVPINEVPLYPRGDIKKFYASMYRQPDTVFVFDNNQPIVLRSATGVLLEIEAGSFTYPGGEVATGTIRLTWKEIRSLYEQVARGISMRTVDGLLQGSITWDWQADQEGSLLILAKPVVVKWPYSSPSGSVQLWYGAYVGEPILTWQPVMTGGVGISSWIDPVLGSGASGFLIQTNQQGILSVAHEDIPVAGFSDKLEVKLFPAYDASNTAVFFLETGSKHARALTDSGDGLFVLPQLPFGRTGRVFCVTEAVKNRFFSTWQDINFTGPQRLEPRPGEKTLPMIYEMLLSL